MNVNRTKVVLCGPPVTAVGGGPTHIRSMLGSVLGRRYELIHFETGSRGAESPAKDEGVAARLARMLVSPFRLAWIIARSRARIVHINSVMDRKALWRDTAYAAVSKAFGCRVAMQMHGGSLPELCRGGRRRLVRRALALPDAVVLLATKEREDFAREGILERVMVIPNGVEIADFRRSTEHSGRVRRLVYIGRLIRAKGVFDAVSAVELLRDDAGFEDVELRIAGSGPDRMELERWIAARGLQDRVKLVGPVYGTAKAEFLRSADVLVFPTYHLEGLPYCILESLAAGTPVVATPVAGIPDAVVDGVHGRLVAPRAPHGIAAALRDLARSEERLRAMSRACQIKASESFSLERLAERFDDLYAKLDGPAGIAGAESR